MTEPSSARALSVGGRVVQGYGDDTGWRLPVLCHAGDLLSRYARGHAVEAILDTIRAAGYHGIRTWTFLAGSYWAGRTFTLTEDVLRRFLELLRTRGLKALLSQGDLWQAQVSEAERLRVRDVQRACLAAGDRDVILGLDGANEPINNGGVSAVRLKDWLAPLRREYPDLALSTGAIGELPGDTPDTYAARRRQYADGLHEHHIAGSNGAQIIARHWTEGYESPTWLHRASEPRGPGRRVSGTRITDPAVLQLMAVASVMSGGEYTYFCGPGVISDEDERFSDMAGFREVPALIASLPQDLHTWPRRCHGGQTWAGMRVYAVPPGVEARAEHTLAADGRCLILLHGREWPACVTERAHTVTAQWDYGAHGRLILGRVT